jgi:pantetheine-phosphate adenylyltransferase
MKHRAVFAGSFDSMHNGHIDVIKRASKLFDYLYVAVSENIDKKYTLSNNKRFQIVKRRIEGLNLKNVSVVENNGLTVDLVKRLKCQYLIRSIRNSKDVGYEINMAQNNFLLNQKIETIFFVASSKLKDISSTNQKELVRQKKMIIRDKHE